MAGDNGRLTKGNGLLSKAPKIPFLSKRSFGLMVK